MADHTDQHGAFSFLAERTMTMDRSSMTSQREHYRQRNGIVLLMKLPTLLLTVGVIFSSMIAQAELSPNTDFEKDRQAILGMAGDFSVEFRFQETFSLHEGYQANEKPYLEDAHETVKIAEDSGRRIVLQHILQVDKVVVKHWSHIWTYEDREILEFRGHRTWGNRMISENEAKGAWTQRVTEVTDEPRYEGIGRWMHHAGSSEWTSDISNRPLPRREYTKRSDYDLLLVTNRHTVTPTGWYHEQDNTKWVKRGDQDYPLCREVGFNRYLRVKDQDFAKANRYWEKTAGFWSQFRKIWETTTNSVTEIQLHDQVNGESFYKIVGNLTDRVSQGETISDSEMCSAITSFIVAKTKTAQP
jgi:hypothetical protein